MNTITVTQLNSHSIFLCDGSCTQRMGNRHCFWPPGRLCAKLYITWHWWQ